MKNLSIQLIETFFTKRLQVKNFPQLLQLLRASIMEILSEKEEVSISAAPVDVSSKICAVCPRKRDRKGRHRCVKCNRDICAEHSLSICQLCN